MASASQARTLAAELQFKWNLDDVDVRTKTVEKTLAPLVNQVRVGGAYESLTWDVIILPIILTQVTTLASTRGDKHGKRKRQRGAKRAAELVRAVEMAIENFVARGNEIVADNPDAASQLETVLNEVRVRVERSFALETTTYRLQSSGAQMVDASSSFVSNPCSSERRTRMVQCAQHLLTAVTRLLVVADMIDVRALVQVVDKVN